MKEIYSSKDISYYSHTRQELLKYIPDTIKVVLDVGCGGGNFGSMLKEIYQCEVWGIEPDVKAATIAKEKLDIVINSNFDENIAFKDHQKFDCIFFNDVLEHLAQPEEALDLAKKLLKIDGCIIASIPNIRFYPSILSLIRYKDFKYLDAGVMDRTHLRFFTKKSMIRLFEDNKLEIKIIEGINEHRFFYFEILNFLLFKSQKDMRYPQYVVVSTLKS